jgi:hypothetical protein
MAGVAALAIFLDCFPQEKSPNNKLFPISIRFLYETYINTESYGNNHDV